MPNVRFTKLSATGNDFILIDNRENALPEIDCAFFRVICQRRYSIGADGVLLIEKDSVCDFKLRYFNADGSETECGNGARAAAYYCHKHKICRSKTTFSFGANIYAAEINGNVVKIKSAPWSNLKIEPGVNREKSLVEAGSINTGTPHYVLFSKEIEKLDVIALSKTLKRHDYFKPDGTNFNFVQIDGANQITLRTYERGVENETLACGTGAMAAAFFATKLRHLQYPVKVNAQGGQLTVDLSDDGKRFFLSGETTSVFDGQLTI